MPCSRSWPAGGGVGLIRRMIGDGAPMLLERALLHVGAAHRAADLMARFSVHYGEHAVRLTTLYPAVTETLSSLRAAGCRLGVCTNKPIDRRARCWRRSGWTR